MLMSTTQPDSSKVQLIIAASVKLKNILVVNSFCDWYVLKCDTLTQYKKYQTFMKIWPYFPHFSKERTVPSSGWLILVHVDAEMDRKEETFRLYG